MLIRSGLRRFPSPSRALLIACAGLLSVCGASLVSAQDPAPPAEAQPASGTAALEELVGRIALYPDDLLSIVLPAATFPLQIVEADRWLAENKGNDEAMPKESWDESIKALINYPDVITMMSNDLDWTSAMGEAVAADQTAVMDAVQSFRRKAEGAGNSARPTTSRSSTVEEEVVKIVQADPQVIYVPQYEPQVVVVQQTVPVYPTYYPTPYPCYYYPYPPGYSFAPVSSGAQPWLLRSTGTAAAFTTTSTSTATPTSTSMDGNTINNRPTNIDRDQSQQMSQEGRGSWQSKQSPSDVRQGRAPQRRRGRQAAVAHKRATRAAGRGAAQGQRAPRREHGRLDRARPAVRRRRSRNQPSNSASSSRYSNTSRDASAARSSPPSKDAFSGMSSGRSVSAASSRGAMSRGGGGGGGRRR